MQEYLAHRGGPSVCSSLFLRNAQGRLLLGLRHYTPDKFKATSLWTTPGGRCDEDESVGENLLRELEEETGITEASIDDFVGVTPGAKLGDTLYVFVGTTAAEPQLMEPDKFSEWRWFDVEQVPDNFINPSALRLYLNYLDRP